MRRLLAFLCLIRFSCAIAQSYDVEIVGRVFDSERNPVESCIVAILQPSDSAIIAYAMTNQQGEYSLTFGTTLSKVLFRLTGFNVKQKILEIKAKSQNLDIIAEEENLVLKEVQIQAQRLWGNKDTINYLVSAYITQHDKSIGDVLKQLPGISIEPNGEIKYQGVPINHFYIENMDVLQGRYNLATTGIRAEDVATVQVLENHEHVKALQDQIPPESAAINLKLKEKARGKWSGTLDVGAGYDNNILWDAKLREMFIAKDRQHFLTFQTTSNIEDLYLSQSFYGNDDNSSQVLTDVMNPGNSPIGRSLRGNLFSFDFSNLKRISEDKILHYNLTYNHFIERRSSHFETRYFLPNDDMRLLTEDISSRHTTNDALLELALENNSDTRYFKNTLKLNGQWTEGNGLVTLNGDDVSQHSYNRSIGLSDRLHKVHRTDNGGGYELKSNNVFGQSPQALSILGTEQRQDAKVTRITSKNSISLIKNINRKRWTLVPIANINIEYVGLSSILNGVVDSLSRGDMDYLNAEALIGTTIRYVKNDFRMTFNTPLSLSYTMVDNKSAPDNKDKTRFRFKPSVSIIWKMSQRWSIYGDAGYNAKQTSWRQLFANYIMTDYRTVQRYVADLNDTQTLNAHSRIVYKDIFREFFFHIDGTVSRTWKDIIYGTTIDDKSHTVIQAEYMPHHSDYFQVSATISKGYKWQNTKLEATASVSQNDTKTLLQSVARNYSSRRYLLKGIASTDIVQRVRVNYNCSLSYLQSLSDDSMQKIFSFSQDLSVNISLISNRLLLMTKCKYSHLPNNSGSINKGDYVFLDSSLTYRTKRKQHEISLMALNLTDTRNFIECDNEEFVEYIRSYSLRPRGFMLTMRLMLH